MHRKWQDPRCAFDIILCGWDSGDLSYDAMKTNITSLPAVPFHANQATSMGPRLRVAARRLFAALCATLLTILAAPDVLADGPDGEYKFESSMGSISVGDASIPLPQKQIRNKIAALRNGRMVIKDGRIQLDRKTAKLIIRRIFSINNPAFTVDTTITGPTEIQLHNDGKGHIGSTVRPVVVSIDGTIKGDEIDGYLKNKFTAKVRDDTLKLTIYISGHLLGKLIRGVIVATCKRETSS
jgi:hypothetical protein